MTLMYSEIYKSLKVFILFCIINKQITVILESIYTNLIFVKSGPCRKRNMVHKRILKPSKITRVIIIMTIIVNMYYAYYIILYIFAKNISVPDTLLSLLLLMKCIIIYYYYYYCGNIGDDC
jgi:hypothetical protein